MIFIPSQISLDRGRDVYWKEIKRLHEIWNARRQVKVFSVAKHERREKALKAFELWNSKEGEICLNEASVSSKTGTRTGCGTRTSTSWWIFSNVPLRNREKICPLFAFGGI